MSQHTCSGSFLRCRNFGCRLYLVALLLWVVLLVGTMSGLLLRAAAS